MSSQSPLVLFAGSSPSRRNRTNNFQQITPKRTPLSRRNLNVFQDENCNFTPKKEQTYKEIERLQKSLESKKADLQAAARIGKSLLSENEILKSRLAELEQTEDELCESKSKVAQLEYSKQAYIQQIEMLEAELKEASNDAELMKEMRERSSRSESLESKTQANWQQERENLISELSEVQAQLKRKQEALSNYVFENDELQKTNQSLEKREAEAREEAIKLTQIVDNMETRSKTETSQVMQMNEDLRNEVNSLQLELRHALENYTTLQQTLEDGLRHTPTTCTPDVFDRDSSLDDFLSPPTIARHDREMAQSQKKVQDNGSIKEAILIEQVNTMQSQYDDLQQELRDTKQEVSQLQTSKQRLATEAKQASDAFSVLYKENYTLLSQVSSLQAAVKSATMSRVKRLASDKANWERNVFLSSCYDIRVVLKHNCVEPREQRALNWMKLRNISAIRYILVLGMSARGRLLNNTYDF
eukprot:m.232123 g.232123  ORF g.232123 m.232123 type:complete len:473 (+) comp16016_c0_seq5:223-1641(+)